MNVQPHSQGAHERTAGKMWVLTVLALSFAVVVAGVLVALPHYQVAHASAATLTVVPKSGSYSAQAGIVTKGQHFAAGETVKVYWNYTGPETGVLEATATADATKGAFTAKFQIPLNPSGTYTIAGVGQTSGSVATDTFQLLPQLYSIPEAGATGSSFTIYGNAFASGETVNIYSNYTGPGTGTLLGTATGDTNGSFTVKVALPAGTIPGSLIITGVGQSSNTTASFSFVVYQPTLTLAPLSGSAGTLLTMTAYGFQKNEKINIFWNNGSTPVLVGKTDSNVYGYMPPTTYTVPDATVPGTYPVKAVGQTSGTTVTTNFTAVSSSSSVGQTSTRSFTAPVTLDTSWGNYGFDPAQDRQNPLENTLNSSNAGSLNLKWTGSMGKNFQGSPVYANGTIYAVSITGTLNAFDATSGTLKWKVNSKTNFKNLAAPVVDPATGMVFFGTIGYESSGIPSPLYALDAQTGTLKWSMILAWNVYGPPTVASNTLYVGTARGPYTTQLYALDEITGNIHWQFTANGSVWGAIAVDTSTSTAVAFISNPGSVVTAFDTTSGAVKCQATIANSSSSSEAGSGIAISNGYVYLNGKNGNLYKLKESDCSSIWTTYIGVQPTGQGNIASPAIDSKDTIVFAGAMDNNLNAVDISSGNILWKKNIGLIYGSPVVANGVVYLATLGGKRIYAINATAKTTLFNYLTGGLIYSSPIVVNGWLYCGSTDGKLYAFGL